ncbi:MAG TPA: cupin domain-containing protein [Gaiellaceae bacterium]
MSAAPQPQDPAEWPKTMDFVRPTDEEMAKQDIPALFGVNAGTTSSRGIAMLLTMFEPGGNSNCHMHLDSETALYVVSGSAHFFFGEHLERDQIVNAGDFVYVPPFCPHKGFNRSRKERVVFVTARTDALEQERVVVTPEADDGTAGSNIDYID